MLKDFSDQSEHELLSLVKEVEHDKICDFTDWLGDRWYDFEELIGELNIKNYIDNVNSYHKKVIDKNNATVSSIEGIFRDVKAVDSAYGDIFANIRDSLEKDENYISKMAEIISPAMGSFTVGNVKAILSQAYDDLEQSEVKAYLGKYEKIVNGKPVVDCNLLVNNFLRLGYMPEAERTAYSQIIQNSPVELTDALIKMAKNGNDKIVKNAYKLLICIKYRTVLKIEQNGDYFIIKGGMDGFLKNSDLRGLEDIKGTRYKIDSAAFNETVLKYLVPEGTSFSDGAEKFLQNLKNKDLWTDTFRDFDSFKGSMKKIYGFEKNTQISNKISNFGKVLGYAAIAIDTGEGIKEDIDNKATVSHTIGDATANVAKGLGTMAIATGCAQVGAAIGTAIPIPVVGTVVGAAVGFGLGWAGSKLYDYLVDDAKINGKTVKQWAACGVENGCNAVGNAATGAAKAIQNTGNEVKKQLDSAANAVGNLFGGAGKAVMAW